MMVDIKTAQINGSFLREMLAIAICRIVVWFTECLLSELGGQSLYGIALYSNKSGYHINNELHSHQ